MTDATFRDGDADERVTVRSGPHAMVEIGGMFGPRYRGAADGEDSIDVYSVRRADGTVWLIPAAMLAGTAI